MPVSLTNLKDLRLYPGHLSTMSSHLIFFFHSAEYRTVPINCISFTPCILTTDTLFLFFLFDHRQHCNKIPLTENVVMKPLPLLFSIHHQVLVISPNVSGMVHFPLSNYLHFIQVEIQHLMQQPLSCSPLSLSSFWFSHLQPGMQILVPSLWP